MTVPGRTPGDLSTEDAKLLLDVVQSLYASAMEGTSDIWHNVYRQTARLVASAAGGFVTVDLVNHATDLASVFGFDQKNVVRAYSDYGLESDLLYTHTRSMPAGSPFHGTRMFGPRGIERSPLYEILSVPERLRFVSGGVLENDERHHSILCFWRRSDQADFDQVSQDIIAMVIPHVRQALEVQRRIRGPQLDTLAPGSLTLGSFTNSRHGLLVLDHKGKVLFLNREAERIARADDAIGLRNGFLQVADMGVAAEVERMMSRACAIAHEGVTAPMRPIRMPKACGREAYELLLIPVTDGVQRAILPPAAAFMAVITDLANVAVLADQRLRGYGLTSAEARLCQALIRTGSLADAAEQLHVSASTARSHLKSVFVKFGVNSQVQLVTRLVAGHAAAGDP